VEKSDPQYKVMEAAIGLPPDAKTLISFTLAEVLDMQESEKVNRPIYVDRVHITVRAEGIRDFTSVLAKDEDKFKYPAEWQAFQGTQTTPTSSIPGIKPSEIAMLRARRVHTLQDAAMIENPDPEIASCVMKAKRWVAIESGIKPRIKLEAVA
jgi:hypothetical protein